MPLDAGPAPSPTSICPGALAGPDLLGLVLEATMDSRRRAPGDRRPLHPGCRGRRPDRHRPGDGEASVDVARDGRVEPTVLDPACGGGAFLLAAADRLAAAGIDPATIARRCLWGDRPSTPSRWRPPRRRWRCGRGSAAIAAVRTPASNVAVRRRLQRRRRPGGRSGRPDGVDVVVGNPPFLGQLGRATARTPEESRGGAGQPRLGDRRVHGRRGAVPARRRTCRATRAAR